MHKKNVHNKNIFIFEEEKRLGKNLLHTLKVGRGITFKFRMGTSIFLQIRISH